MTTLKSPDTQEAQENQAVINAVVHPSRPQPPKRTGIANATKFASAGEAWLWTMSCLMARRQGARFSANRGGVIRPCEPDDVVKCLDGLYRQRRIDLLHARVLRIWGERQATPDPTRAAERSDWHIWREALDRLEWPLRVKGIVG
jgi:hypothetical protein